MPKGRKPTRYVRRNERLGDKVRTHYLGSAADPVTRIVVESEDLTRALSQSASETAERELHHHERLETCQKFLHKKISRLFWRRRRGLVGIPNSCSRTRPMEGMMHDEIDKTSDSVSVSRDDFDEIIEDAVQGDEDALQELKRTLKYNSSICERLGDVSRHVQIFLIEALGEESVAVQESIKIEMEKLRGQLNCHHSDPLERLLIEQVITTLLDLSVQQIGSLQPDIKETLRRRWERRMERARKRHLAAIHALLEVRETLYGNNQHFAE